MCCSRRRFGVGAAPLCIIIIITHRAACSFGRGERLSARLARRRLRRIAVELRALRLERREPGAAKSAAIAARGSRALSFVGDGGIDRRTDSGLPRQKPGIAPVRAVSGARLFQLDDGGLRALPMSLDRTSRGIFFWKKEVASPCDQNSVYRRRAGGALPRPSWRCARGERRAKSTACARRAAATGRGRADGAAAAESKTRARRAATTKSRLHSLYKSMSGQGEHIGPAPGRPLPKGPELSHFPHPPGSDGGMRHVARASPAGTWLCVWNRAFVCGLRRSGLECGVHAWNSAKRRGIRRKRRNSAKARGIPLKSGIRAFHTGIRITYWNSRFYRGIQPKGVEFTKQRGIGRRGPVMWGVNWILRERPGSKVRVALSAPLERLLEPGKLRLLRLLLSRVFRV